MASRGPSSLSPHPPDSPVPPGVLSPSSGSVLNGHASVWPLVTISSAPWTPRFHFMTCRGDRGPPLNVDHHRTRVPRPGLKRKADGRTDGHAAHHRGHLGPRPRMKGVNPGRSSLRGRPAFQTGRRKSERASESTGDERGSQEAHTLKVGRSQMRQCSGPSQTRHRDTAIERKKDTRDITEKTTESCDTPTPPLEEAVRIMSVEAAATRDRRTTSLGRH